MRRMLALDRMALRSFGTAFLMLLSALPVISQEAIPQRNMMLKQKPHFLVYALRYVGLIDRSENAPEAILRMAVIKHILPRFH